MNDISESKIDQLLVFALDDRRYALNLEAVERVLRAVEIAPLPDSPEYIAGIINVKGRIIPAVDLRKRLLLPEKEPDPDDRLVIFSAGGRTFAFTADTVLGVMECPAESVVPATEILPRMGPVDGVLVVADGMVLIPDIEKLLSLEEETALDGILPALVRGMPAGEAVREHGNDVEQLP